MNEKIDTAEAEIYDKNDCLDSGLIDIGELLHYHNE